MKLSIQCADLQKSLGHVQSVVEKRTTIPILSNVLLTAKDSTLAFCATDMDLEVTDATPATVEVEGATTVPAHTLYDIIRKLPEDSTATLALNDDKTMMTVSAGRSQFKLGCLPKEDFPEMTAGGVNGSFNLPVEILRKVIDHTRFAISTEETRYYLNGVYLHVADNHEGDKVLRAVATDGHRLARFESPLPEGAGDMPGVIIPRKTIQELRKLLDETGEEITINFSDKIIQFQFGHVVLTSKLIDGTFPDYERVIPKNNNKVLNVEPRAFTKAVDRVSTIAAEKTRAVKLNVSGTTMTLSASNTESGTATEELEVTYDDDAGIDIGFNARYLLDVTELLGDNCSIYFSDSASPTIIQDNQDLSALYVLMPMRV